MGKFGAPHGVRGEVRIKSYTADPLAIARYGELRESSGQRRFTFVSVRLIKDDMLVARVAGLATREAAAALTNLDIYVDRAQLPPPDEDEYYLSDLIGMEARFADGARYGRVVDAANFGAGDILEIDIGAADTKLIPFTRAAVPAVNMNENYLIVDPPREIDARPEDDSAQ